MATAVQGAPSQPVLLGVVAEHLMQVVAGATLMAVILGPAWPLAPAMAWVTAPEFLPRTARQISCSTTPFCLLPKPRLCPRNQIGTLLPEQLERAAVPQHLVLGPASSTRLRSWTCQT